MFRTILVPTMLLFPLMGAECSGTALPDVVDPGDGIQQPAGDAGNTGESETGGDSGGDAASELEALLGGKVLTEIRSSNNIDPLGGPAFLQFFRSDLELCTNGRFEYFEVDETTISFVLERNEFSGSGEWSVRIDEATGEALLKLNFLKVSEGEPFEGEAPIELNIGGESFFNGVRMFVTEGDDVCE